MQINSDASIEDWPALFFLDVLLVPVHTASVGHSSAWCIQRFSIIPSITALKQTLIAQLASLSSMTVTLRIASFHTQVLNQKRQDRQGPTVLLGPLRILLDVFPVSTYIALYPGRYTSSHQDLFHAFRACPAMRN